MQYSHSVSHLLLCALIRKDTMAKVAKKAKTTREAAAIFGLGAGITKKVEEITGCRLPTKAGLMVLYVSST